MGATVGASTRPTTPRVFLGSVPAVQAIVAVSMVLSGAVVPDHVRPRQQPRRDWLCPRWHWRFGAYDLSRLWRVCWNSRWLAATFWAMFLDRTTGAGDYMGSILGETHVRIVAAHWPNNCRIP